ncbi:hypothetical protein [Haloplanus salilacus]|uniref:hypothetical protein n=1 Tax=Haloplanus salilacus TaxID=2949994 RepID=UPI0030CB22D8
MNRRTLLRTAPLTALCGCVGAPSDTDDGIDEVSERTLRDTGRCEDPEAATVSVSGTQVRIEGCVTGPNGCSVSSLGSATVEENRLTVVVTTRRDAPPDTACTEALVYRGYVATVETDGEPAGVRVLHETPEGRRTVAEWPEDS